MKKSAYKHCFWSWAYVENYQKGYGKKMAARIDRKRLNRLVKNDEE